VGVRDAESLLGLALKCFVLGDRYRNTELMNRRVQMPMENGGC